ncbi:DUF5068 domain-containing protein [Paenisporosarcina indica]|uniref:DUF5068 domain-containing protein n=1 Tax=Paenisporosarcina indica TaxID=650093 RepID=UPI000B1A08EB|nr:DUF5068 domain-containing protein [Paenisporosarcina indica]
MGNSKILLGIIFSVMLLLAACGDEEKASGSKEVVKSKPKIEEKVEKAQENSTEEDSAEEVTSVASKETVPSTGEVLNPNIAVETEGNVEVIYTNKDPKYTHDMSGFKVSVDEYQIVKVTDMNEYSKISFDDQINGYVVSTKVTIENGTSKPMYYNNNHKIQVSNNFDNIPANWKTLVPEDQQINKIKKNKEKVSLFEAGEKVTGLMSFTLTDDEFEKLKTVKPKYIIEGGLADNDQYKNINQQQSPAYDFIYSGEQGEQTATAPTFYQDRLTTDNMADKKMIFEKSGINETKQIGDVNVTLDGVQYTDVIPTEANKARFQNFGESGVVALTVKLKIDNQSSAPVSIWNIGSKIVIDENRGTAIAEGMAEPQEPQEIAAGQQGEKLHVFLFNKDEFGIFKKFDLEFGPFTGSDGKDLFKGRTATFTLPR